jgi:hypothetical protein
MAAFRATCDVQSLGQQCPHNVDPHHSIARDQRPLRVMPKTAEF